MIVAVVDVLVLGVAGGTGEVVVPVITLDLRDPAHRWALRSIMYNIGEYIAEANHNALFTAVAPDVYGFVEKQKARPRSDAGATGRGRDNSKLPDNDNHDKPPLHKNIPRGSAQVSPKS